MRDIPKNPKSYEFEKYRPNIQVPPFWPVSWKQMNEQFANVKRGLLVNIGSSYCGRLIRGVEYRKNQAPLKVAFIAGDHGHEPTGPAGIFNLISYLEYGETLHGKRLDPIFDNIEFFLVPVVNIDGRCRNLDSFVGLTSADSKLWGYGLNKNGEHVPSMKHVDTSDILLIGGKYNDQGIDLTADDDPGKLQTPENQSLLNYLIETKPDLLIDFHCAQHSSFLIGTTGKLDKAKRQILWQFKLAVTKAGREHGYTVISPTPDCSEDDPLGIRSYGMYMLETGCWTALFEVPAGLIDTPPCHTHGELIDLVLFFMRECIITAKNLKMKNWMSD